MVVGYEDVVALEDFSPRLTAMIIKTYKMMVETIIQIRGNYHKKERLRCSVNGGMGEYAFGTQELKETVSLQLLGSS